ncbi:hypothetical protein L6R50_11365 [Myxococcota bacterium]|nr:hypothetical protein [Myxococcota bacterium]
MPTPASPAPVLLLAALALWGAGCASPCEQYARNYCDTCGSDVENYVCACVSKESLGAGDYPEGLFPSDEDATLACREFLVTVRLPDSDAEATCAASLRLMELHGSRACEDLEAATF